MCSIGTYTVSMTDSEDERTDKERNTLNSDSETDDENETKQSCTANIKNGFLWLCEILYLSNKRVSLALASKISNRKYPTKIGDNNDPLLSQELLLDCIERNRVSKGIITRHVTAMVKTMNLPVEFVLNYVDDLSPTKAYKLHQFSKEFLQQKNNLRVYKELLKQSQEPSAKARIEKLQQIAQKALDILPVALLEIYQGSTIDRKHDNGVIVEPLNILEMNMHTIQALADCDIINEILDSNKSVASSCTDHASETSLLLDNRNIAKNIELPKAHASHLKPYFTKPRKDSNQVTYSIKPKKDSNPVPST